MSRILWNHWPRLQKDLRSKKRKLFFLDFDGTLAPITKTPDAVKVSPGIRHNLDRLSRRPGWRVIVISGRALKDLKSHLKLKKLWYVGNHGLEIEGKGLPLPAEVRSAREKKTTLSFILRKLRADFQCLPGFLIEDKNFAVSLHFRNLPKECSAAFAQALKFLRHRYKNQPVYWRRGKKVWEIVPEARWHKGYAALHFLKKFPGSFPIALGDDRSDEDMFRGVRRLGLTVHVGRSQKTCADYYLRSQNDVEHFLEALCDEFVPKSVHF